MAETDLILAAKATALPPAMADGDVGPLTLTTDGRLRIESKPTELLTIVQGELTLLGSTLAIDVEEASNIVFHLKNTGIASMAAGAFIFEGSLTSTDGNDGEWFEVNAVRSNGNVVETSRPTLSIGPGASDVFAYEASVNALRWFRIRTTTAPTTNAIAKWTIIRGLYASEPAPVVQTHPVTQSGAFTVGQSGSWTVSPPSGSGLSFVTTASTNAASDKASAGNLFEISAYNTTATAAYLKLYNKASAPTVGTDVPLLTIPIAANSLVALQFGPLGKRFSTGIAHAVTALATVADTGNAVAGIQISATYV